MKRSLKLFAVALALGLTAASQSQADPNITYQWIGVTTDNLSLPQSLTFSQLVVPGHPLSGYQADPNGGLTFLPETSTTTEPIGSGTDITAANIFVTSTALSSNPDQILAPHSGTNYSAELQVTNGADVADITFKMLLTTNMQPGKDGITGANPPVSATANLLNSIHDISYSVNGGAATDVTSFTDPSNPSVAVTLGDAVVTVGFQGFSSVETSQHDFGGLSFSVSSAAVSGGISGGPTTPEPSSVVLGCLGLSCLGGVFWRARRRKTAGPLKAAA